MTAIIDQCVATVLVYYAAHQQNNLQGYVRGESSGVCGEDVFFSRGCIGLCAIFSLIQSFTRERAHFLPRLCSIEANGHS